MNKSCTTGITDILEHLIPRLLVNTAMKTETVYSDMLELMRKLLLQLQQENTLAREQLKKLTSLLIAIMAECLSWEWFKNDLLRYEGKAYMPSDSAVHAEIMHTNYNDPQSGHFSFKCTLKFMHHKYYWHNMAQDIKKHIFLCDIC
jgi:hypothetical protein